MHFFYFITVMVLLAVSTRASTNDVVEWREPSRLSTGAWGRMTRLTNGNWLAVVTRFARPEPSHLAILVSTNSCQTWTNLSEIKESGRNLDNGNLLTLSDGRLLLTGRSLVDEQSYQLPVYSSDDSGRHWTYLSNIDSNEGAPGTLKNKGLWEPYLFLLPDGRVAVIYSSEKHASFSQVLSERISSDQGKTWGPEIQIVAEPGGGRLRPGMGVPERLSDGRFILVYEVVGIGRGEVRYKISVDGVTWPEGLGTAIPNQEAAPAIVALPDGRLMVTSCSRTFSLSEDKGATWRSVPSPWASEFKYVWPALYSLGSNEVVALSSSREVRLDFGRVDSAEKRTPVVEK